jgi:hypothetical protein
MRVLASDLPANAAHSKPVPSYFGAPAVAPDRSCDPFLSDKRRHNDKHNRAQDSADCSSNEPRLLHQTIPQI